MLQTARSRSGPICVFSYFRLRNGKTPFGFISEGGTELDFQSSVAEIMAESPLILVVEDEFFLQADLDDGLSCKKSIKMRRAFR